MITAASTDVADDGSSAIRQLTWGSDLLITSQIEITQFIPRIHSHATCRFASPGPDRCCRVSAGPGGVPHGRRRRKPGEAAGVLEKLRSCSSGAEHPSTAGAPRDAPAAWQARILGQRLLQATTEWWPVRIEAAGGSSPRPPYLRRRIRRLPGRNGRTCCVKRLAHLNPYFLLARAAITRAPVICICANCSLTP